MTDTTEATPTGASPTADEKTWPLVIWMIKKDEMPFIEEQGKEALNFQITVLIGYVACMVLTIVLIGAFLMPILWIFNLVMCLLAGIKVQKGEHYRYPFALRLIK